MRASSVALIGAGCLALLWGLGGCEERHGHPGRASEPAAETVDELPRLPPGWSEEVNHDGGFALGVPPGWSATSHGPRTELRSPERLAAVSLSADRTARAISAPLRRLASATLRAGLPGVRDVHAERPQAFRHPYRAVSVRATAIAGDPGVPEDLELVLIRRDSLATYTALVAENAAHGGAYAALIDRMLATLRGRPVGSSS